MWELVPEALSLLQSSVAPKYANFSGQEIFVYINKHPVVLLNIFVKILIILIIQNNYMKYFVFSL